MVHAEWKFDAVVVSPIAEAWTRREPLVIDFGVDRILRRTSGKHICQQTFIPAGDLAIDRPAILGAPVPIEMIASIAPIPSPLCLPPEPVDAVSKVPFGEAVLVEILACAEKPLE